MTPNTEYTKRDWDSHPPYIVPDYGNRRCCAAAKSR